MAAAHPTAAAAALAAALADRGTPHRLLRTLRSALAAGPGRHCSDCRTCFPHRSRRAVDYIQCCPSLHRSPPAVVAALVGAPLAAPRLSMLAVLLVVVVVAIMVAADRHARSPLQSCGFCCCRPADSETAGCCWPPRGGAPAAGRARKAPAMVSVPATALHLRLLLLLLRWLLSLLPPLAAALAIFFPGPPCRRLLPPRPLAASRAAAQDAGAALVPTRRGPAGRPTGATRRPAVPPGRRRDPPCGVEIGHGIYVSP